MVCHVVKFLYKYTISAGSCTFAEQLGELLHGDPDGDWFIGLYHELHHWQEQK